MRILAIQNFMGTGLGQIGVALDEVGANVEFVRAQLGDTLPATPDGYDGMVVLGGGQNALADDKSPWLPQLCQLMRAFDDAGRSVLGVCLGSQLLARAYGGENIIGGAREFGWQEIELTKEGMEDPVFAGLPPVFRSFQWHDDTFTLPQGSIHLARSARVANQAFRIGRATYGFQFHFEAHQQMVTAWNETFADWLAEAQPDWNERHPVEAARYGARADEDGLMIARNWVRTLSAA